MCRSPCRCLAAAAETVYRPTVDPVTFATERRLPLQVPGASSLRSIKPPAFPLGRSQLPNLSLAQSVRHRNRVRESSLLRNLLRPGSPFSYKAHGVRSLLPLLFQDLGFDRQRQVGGILLERRNRKVIPDQVEQVRVDE
jgi:hypothetical protein